MSQLDAVIVSPPWCQIDGIAGPPLAPAQLAGYLSKLGMRSRAVDLGIRFAHWIARPGGLLDQRLSSAVEAVKALAVPGSPSAAADRQRGLDALRYLSNIPAEILAPALAGAPAPSSGNPWLTTPVPMIGPPWFSKVHFAAPAGILGQSVAGAIDELGCENLIDDFYSTAEATALLSEVAEARVVGISISFPAQIGGGLRLARIVSALSDAVVVLGGVALTMASDAEREALARLPFVAGVVVHAGELPLRRLVETRGQRALLGMVPGLVYDHEGTICATAVGARVPASDLPTPQFDAEAVALYPPGTSLPILVTRGCYWNKCTFCDERNRKHPGQPGYDARAADEVAADIRALIRQHAITRYAFITDAAPPSWCDRFARAALATGLKIEFWTFLKNHPQGVFTPDFARRMKAAGMTVVTFGVENFSPRVIDLMNKGASRQDRIDNIRTFAAAGVAVHINIIPDFPSTVREEAIDGLRTIVAHRDALAHVSPLRFMLEADTDIANMPAGFGLEVVSDPGATSRNMAFRRTEGIGEDDCRELLAAYEELEGWLALYHHTAESRERMSRADFIWSDAVFSFRSFAIVENCTPLGKVKRAVDYLIVPELGVFFDVSHDLAPFVRSLAESSGSVLSFAELRSRYLACGPGPKRSGPERGLIDLLARLVHNGLVHRIGGGTSEVISPLAEAQITRLAEAPVARERGPWDPADLRLVRRALRLAP